MFLLAISDGSSDTHIYTQYALTDGVGEREIEVYFRDVICTTFRFVEEEETPSSIRTPWANAITFSLDVRLLVNVMGTLVVLLSRGRGAGGAATLLLDARTTG